jgi:hypothetical protein
VSYPPPTDQPGPEYRVTAPGWPPPSRPRPWLWIGAVALAFAAGAGTTLALSNSPEPSRAEQAAAALPGPSATAAAKPAPGPTPQASGLVGVKPLKLGQAHTFVAKDGTKAAVTVLKHQVHRDTYGIQVRTCNRGNITFVASPYPWFLSYDGGEELSQDSITGGGLLAPEFTQGELEPGGCRKGWLSFVKSGTPDGAEYRIEGETRARWEW